MVVVNPRVESTVSEDLLAELRKIAPATIGHLLEHEFMDGDLRPIISRFKFAGPAITVQEPRPVRRPAAARFPRAPRRVGRRQERPSRIRGGRGRVRVRLRGPTRHRP